MTSVFDLENKDPFDAYAEIRRCSGGGQWDEEHRAWVVAAQSGCSFVQRREDVYRHPYEDMNGSEHVKGRRSLLLLKGEEHKRVHRYFSRYFATQAERIGREVVRPIVDRLIDGLEGRTLFELGEDFIDPIPVRTIAVVLGFDLTDDRQLNKCKDINDRLTRWTESLAADEAIVADAKLAADELRDLIGPIAREKRANPGDDLLSALHRDGPGLLDDWDDDVLVDQMKTLFPAGSHTTANFLCSAMYLLLTHPEVRPTLRAEPALVSAFVEEALRLVGPIHIRLREAAVDHELSPGLTVAAGEQVHALLAAAGRDPAVYTEPDRIDLHRDALRRHLAFSVGPRVCVGNELAREMSRVTVRAVIERLPTLRLVNDDEAQPVFRGLLMRAYRPLLVTTS